MTAKIVDFVARRLRGTEYRKACKVARGLDRPRFLYMGMKVPRGDRDTVELCIVSNEAGKERRILSRVTVFVDDLRHMIRELDAEEPFHLQVGPREAGVDGH